MQGGDEIAIQHGDLLSCWKEIAAYLGKGVRTVQRWERDFSLPVRRRHGTSPKTSVMAMRSEIDAWLELQQVSGEAPESKRNGRLLRRVDVLRTEIKECPA
jgi:predicted DNA-binding transcriptional regulator AlpA